MLRERNRTVKIEDIHLETKDGVTTFRMGELVMVVKLRTFISEPPIAATWDILDVLEPPEARAEFLKRKNIPVCEHGYKLPGACGRIECAKVKK